MSIKKTFILRGLLLFLIMQRYETHNIGRFGENTESSVAVRYLNLEMDWKKHTMPAGVKKEVICRTQQPKPVRLIILISFLYIILHI